MVVKRKKIKMIRKEQKSKSKSKFNKKGHDRALVGTSRKRKASKEKE